MVKIGLFWLETHFKWHEIVPYSDVIKRTCNPYSTPTRCRCILADSVLSVFKLKLLCARRLCVAFLPVARTWSSTTFVTPLVWSRAIQIGKYTTTRRILYELLSIDFNILSQYKYTIYIYIGAEMRTDH